MPFIRIIHPYFSSKAWEKGAITWEIYLKIKKKLDPRGASRPPGINVRRRTSHAGRENPRTPAPPLHRGPVTHTVTRVRAGRGEPGPISYMAFIILGCYLKRPPVL